MSLVRYIPRPSDEDISSLNFHRLASFRTQVHGQEDGKKVAQQFEALLIQQVLKQARQASVAMSGYGSGQMGLVQALSDEQTALRLGDPGLGLAKALLDQMPAKIRGLRSVKAVEHMPGHIQAFIEKIMESAKTIARRSGIPEKLMLSQAALESGWGRREIAREDGSTSFNLFGIKAGAGWHGKVANVMTTEYVNGKPLKTVQAFRVYDSYAESLSDYARLISQSARYRTVMQATSAEDAARRIQDAGYATDPDYANKLISIMSYFDASH